MARASDGRLEHGELEMLSCERLLLMWSSDRMRIAGCCCVQAVGWMAVQGARSQATCNGESTMRVYIGFLKPQVMLQIAMCSRISLVALFRFAHRGQCHQAGCSPDGFDRARHGHPGAILR